MMENVDLPPSYSTVANVTTPSVEVLMPPDETVEKPKIDEEPLVRRLFDDRNARVAFVQRILLSILLQAILTALIMIAFIYNYHEHLQVCAVIALCVYVAMLGLLLACDKARTQNPYKTITFVAYPVIVAVFMGFSTLGYSIKEMYVAYLCYCMTIFALLVYSILLLQSNLEYRVVAGIFISAVVLLAVFGLTTVITSQMYYFEKNTTFYYIIGMFAECSYTVWDIQMMMSSKYRYTVTPSDIILGVLLIRIDFIYYIITYTWRYVQIIIGFKD